MKVLLARCPLHVSETEALSEAVPGIAVLDRCMHWAHFGDWSVNQNCLKPSKYACFLGDDFKPYYLFICENSIYYADGCEYQSLWEVIFYIARCVISQMKPEITQIYSFSSLSMCKEFQATACLDLKYVNLLTPLSPLPLSPLHIAQLLTICHSYS